MQATMGNSDTMIIMLTVMLSLFALVGSIGNGLSTFVFYKIRDKTSAHIFILSLSVIDLFTCTVIIPFTIVMEYRSYEITYDFVCKLYQFLITSKVPLSTFMMAAIAFDRYFCICHSLRRIVNPFRTKVVVACLVTFACALGVTTSLNYGVYWKGISEISLLDMFNSSTYQHLALADIDYDGEEYERQLFEQFQKHNTSNISSLFKEPKATVIYTGKCQVDNIIFDRNFVQVYQKCYSLLFGICLIISGVLYALIYRFIHSRRSKKLKQKLIMCTYTHGNPANNVTKVTNASAGGGDDKMPTKLLLQKSASKSTNSYTSRDSPRFSEEAEKLLDEARAANIKTAFMLFIVSVVYILAFSPAWMMALHVVPLHKVVFYLYFIYNVANPFIYAFMNQTFNEHLKQIFRCK